MHGNAATHITFKLVKPSNSMIYKTISPFLIFEVFTVAAGPVADEFVPALGSDDLLSQAVFLIFTNETFLTIQSYYYLVFF
jgi:hypothetical protein